jgi:hypothetical protein
MLQQRTHIVALSLPDCVRMPNMGQQSARHARSRAALEGSVAQAQVLLTMTSRLVQQIQTAQMQMKSVERAQTLLKLDLKMLQRRFRTRVITLQRRVIVCTPSMEQESRVHALHRAILGKSVAQTLTLPLPQPQL